MTKHWRYSWLLAAIIGILGIGRAAENIPAKTVAVVTIDDYAPFCVKLLNQTAELKREREKPEMLPTGKTSQRLQGYAWDLVLAALHNANYTVLLKISNWSAAVRDSEAGAQPERLGKGEKASDFSLHLRFGYDTDLAVFNVTNDVSGKTAVPQMLFPVERENSGQFLYSAEPVCESRIVAYIDRRNPSTEISPEKLAGRAVGFLADCAYNDLREAYYDKCKVLHLDDLTIGFRLVRSGRLAAVFAYEPIADADLRANRLTALFVKKIVPDIEPVKEYLRIAANAPNAAKIIADFDDGFAKIPVERKMSLQKKWQLPSE